MGILVIALRINPQPFTLEPEILYLAYLALEVTSPAIVGLNAFLAHLSRRLIGELIVYPCSGVRPASSTISKIFSETAGPIVLILHIHHLQVGGKNNCVFCFDRIRTLVTIVTYVSHRLIMEKSENCQFLLSCWRYLNFVFAEMFIE